MKIRPCIDLHNGKVKQIVGGTLSDNDNSAMENFVSEQRSGWYSSLYKKDKMTGGHIIKLGPGNDEAALEALSNWPQGMQIGGGITDENCQKWLAAGASHIIVTSWVFKDGMIDFERIKKLVTLVGKEKLILDLSCRKKDNQYFVVTDRWQKFTDYAITEEHIRELEQYCDEFLIHAADVEGLCRGIEKDLVALLGEWISIPTTYAGGARNLDDARLVDKLGRGKIDLTIGSALDIFGGDLPYEDVIEWNREHKGI